MHIYLIFYANITKLFPKENARSDFQHEQMIKYATGLFVFRLDNVSIIRRQTVKKKRNLHIKTFTSISRLSLNTFSKRVYSPKTDFQKKFYHTESNLNFPSVFSFILCHCNFYWTKLGTVIQLIIVCNDWLWFCNSFITFY